MDTMSANTLPELFRARVRATPLVDAYMQYDHAIQRWHTWSWADVSREVRHWEWAFSMEDIPPGERVAVMLNNSVEWVCFEQAAMAQGLVVVPLYVTDSPANSAHVLADSGARLLLLGSPGQWARLSPLRALFPVLQRVLCLQSFSMEMQKGDPQILSCDEWLAAHQDNNPAAPTQREVNPSTLATLIYTSGTTGRPKGVMLSHANILSNAQAVLEAISVYETDRLLSILPLSHAFERTAGYYAPMLAGACVAFARWPLDLKEDLKAVQPTALISVPRVYEKLFSHIESQLSRANPLERLAFRRAERTGWRRFTASQARKQATPWWTRLEWALYGDRIARRVTKELGGRLRIAVSGGAPLPSRVARRFLSLGLPLVQGYGLTEASPVVAANRLEDNQPESVGRPLPQVEVQVDARGELLVRGPNVMLGYWNNPKATAAAIDGEGWLHSGDMARLEEGRLFINGRLKEIIVMSTGEKIAPADMEAAIATDAMFEQALIVGEGRPYLIALLVLNPPSWRSLVLAKGFSVSGEEATLREPSLVGAIRDKVNHLLSGFPAWGHVRRVYLTLEPWTIESGLITPTMKPRRQELERRFATEIASLYQQRPDSSARFSRG